MEQFNFDQLIKEKVNQATEIHQKEIDASKPFAWAALQQQLSPQNSLRWYHLAAAVLFITLLFSYLLISVQKNHNSEMEALSGKIDKLQTEYAKQNEIIGLRDQQVVNLKSEMNHMEGQIVELESRDAVPRETIVYRRDTVYLRQVEYISAAEPEPEIKLHAEVPTLPAEDTDEQTVASKIDDEIFPSSTGATSKEQTENVKFRFGSFVAKTN